MTTPTDGAPNAPLPPKGAAETPDAWALVGVISGAFGLHGDLKVRPETDFPERFTRTKTLYLGADHTPYPVASARAHKVSQIVLHLIGVESEAEAERLRGQQLYIPLVELTPLAPEQYYVHDLIGLRVEHVNGETLGEIADVITTAASDLYVVRRPGGSEVLLPAVKEFVKTVSLARGVVVVDPIPGIFDDASVNAAEDATDDDTTEDADDTEN